MKKELIITLARTAEKARVLHNVYAKCNQNFVCTVEPLDSWVEWFLLDYEPTKPVFDFLAEVGFYCSEVNRLSKLQDKQETLRILEKIDTYIFDYLGNL